ncbi:Kynureninase [Mycolicibacterium aubagnense]
MTGTGAAALQERLSIERAACVELDGKDELAPFRDRFDLPQGLIYLDGNSLGAMPRTVPSALTEAATQGWGQQLIRSWNERDWHNLPLQAGDRLAGLLGAAPGEVLVGDSTSINLYKVLYAALSLRADRKTIISERNNFPTDLYVVQGMQRTLFPDHAMVLAEDDDDSVLSLLGTDTAVVSLSHVNYRTGRLRDMKRITQAVHANGALVAWDMCHSVGALAVDLNSAKVDFAVGCTYKYLNAGPGGPAWLYAAARHLPLVESPLTGWHGHRTPFAFDGTYAPAATIEKFRVGTPPILSYLPLLESLKIFQDVDVAKLRAKSLRLTDLFIELVDTELADFGFEVVTPRDHAERGSQVALTHDHGWPIMQALIDAGVIGDFRAPDILRFGFTPLYVTHADVWDAAMTLADIMRNGRWREPRFAERKLVT